MLMGIPRAADITSKNKIFRRIVRQKHAAAKSPHWSDGLNGEILIAEDDRSLRQLLTYTLERAGYAVTDVPDGAAAVEACRQRPFDLILTDVKMPKLDGIEVLRQVKEFDPEIDVVVLTGHSSVESAVAAIKLGAYDYLEKPLQMDRLTATVERIFERKALRRKATSLDRRVKGEFEFHGMLGRSEAMQTLFHNIARMARYNNPVLITGDSGTGKELVARALHAEGRRANKPFVAFNGAGIVDSLFESQLFGHERGAFTGAVRDHAGLMQQADGGTLFIDEVAEVAPSNQAKLLRALETSEVTPVGSRRVTRVDIHIIAATNKDLRRALDAGEFREDLFYRLRGFSLQLPPLRERPDDIELLAEHFLKEANQTNDLHVEGFSGDAKEFLRHYPWPGNIRELRHVVLTAAALTNSPLIALRDLPEDLRPRDVTPPTPQHAPTPPAQPVATPAASAVWNLNELTRRHLADTLEKARGNKSETARLLGVSRHALYRMLRKFGL
jgi:DNA-binding NtrC family response regulator